MKKMITILTIVVCIIILVIGQLYWNNKTTTSVASERITEEGVAGTKTKAALTPESLSKLTNQWPEKSAQTFQEKVAAGEPFHIAFLGSEALGQGSESWPERVKVALHEAYGDHITVSTFSYNQNSITFLNGGQVEEVIAAKPDLIIFEPFTLKDNGVVSTDDSLENTSATIAEMAESLPETQVILQPPHPLFNATYYPIQVEVLAGFAENNDIPYLNHWEAWPDQASEEILDYLNKDTSAPSGKGHEVWAGYLIDYLIAE